MEQAKKLRGEQLMPMLFMYYLHFKKGGVQPLIYQTIMGLYNLYKNPLFKVYVLGETDIPRPFSAMPSNTYAASVSASVKVGGDKGKGKGKGKGKEKEKEVESVKVGQSVAKIWDQDPESAGDDVKSDKVKDEDGSDDDDNDDDDDDDSSTSPSSSSSSSSDDSSDNE